MNVTLLFLFLSLSGIGSRLFSKFCSNLIVGNTTAGYALFYTLNSLVACGFFLVTSGFDLTLNLPTLLYSFLYALVVLAALFFSLLAYRLFAVASLSVLSSALTPVTTSLVGALLFREHPGARTLIRIGVMLIAVFLVFADTAKHREKPGVVPSKKRRGALIFVLSGMILSSCASTIVTKYYALSPRVAEENSFFFFTNAILAVGALSLLLTEALRHPSELRSAAGLLKPKSLISLVGNAVCSNVGSLVSIWLLAQLDVSVFTPISSALGILTGVIVSLLLREKPGIFSYLAAAVACLAVIL